MYVKTSLDNGIKLITVPIKNTNIVTVLFLFPVGSRYEERNLNGISHFIEHMAFKGTRKRPNSLAITKEFDKIGAEYNAFTGKDQTGFWVKTTKKNLEKAIEVLSDMVFNSIFKEKEIEKEKGVIYEEMKMYQENPLLFYEEFFEQCLYTNHPLGQLVIGQKKNIQKINRKDLIDYWSRFYQPNQMVVTIAGGISPKKAKLLTEKHLSSFKTKAKKFKCLPFKKNEKIKSSRVNIFYKNLKQAQIILGGLAYPYAHPQLNSLILLLIILGGNMSSRLFVEIREKRGLAYVVQAKKQCYQDTGHFYIAAGVDKNQTEETIKVILSQLKQIRHQGIEDEEVKMAKDYLIGITGLHLEDSANLAVYYGKEYLLTGKIESPAKKIVKIKKVTKKEIEQVAKKVLKDLSLSIIGPFKNKQRLLRILKKGV